ncbi:trypco2 family protein [Streptomyces sp. NPDC021749]|uniref:trypco2 family protein n=1 Tax=Streptomyces sp. NPDC021749 TaxID=3154905 RepID=UPI0034114C7F
MHGEGPHDTAEATRRAAPRIPRRDSPDGERSSLRFEVSDVTPELSIELRHSASASGGVKAFVVSADTRGGRTKAET